jgi:hypothetical protein
MYPFICPPQQRGAGVGAGAEAQLLDDSVYEVSPVALFEVKAADRNSQP